MFGKLKEMLGSGAKKLAGRTDPLEGICAASALVMAADGDISDDEVETLVVSFQNHAIIGSAFKANEIEAAVDKQLSRARKGMAGKLGLKKEIEEAASKNSSDEMEMLFMIVLDVATADGNITASERTAIDQVGKMVGFSASAYL